MKKHEIWKDIKGFEGIYQISSLGNVKSLSRIDASGHKLKEKILKTPKPIRCKDGYYDYQKVTLANKTYRIHRLVAENFIPNPNNKPEVNHKDKNIFNNNIENLEWVTSSENMKHSFKFRVKPPYLPLINEINRVIPL